MDSICANSSQTGFVLIDHHSSKSGEWRHVQFDTTQYQEAFAELQKIEKAMSFIAAEVKKKSYDELSHLRLVAKPCQTILLIKTAQRLRNEIRNFNTN